MRYLLANDEVSLSQLNSILEAGWSCAIESNPLELTLDGIEGLNVERTRVECDRHCRMAHEFRGALHVCEIVTRF